MERPWSSLTQRTASGTRPPPQVTGHGATARVSHLPEGKAGALEEATPQGKTPSSLGVTQAAAPRHSLPRTPAHQAGHGAARHTSRRVSGLLAGSHSSSWTAVRRAESTHVKRSSIRPAGRKKGPRAPRRGLSQDHGAIGLSFPADKAHAGMTQLCH